MQNALFAFEFWKLPRRCQLEQEERITQSVLAAHGIQKETGYVNIHGMYVRLHAGTADQLRADLDQRPACVDCNVGSHFLHFFGSSG